MKKLLTAFAVLTVFISYGNEEKTTVKSDLKNVTVYKTGAELVHTATATLKQGNNELIVDKISNQLDINSIQVKTSSAVTLMGIEFVNNYLIPMEKTERVKSLEDSLQKVNADIFKLNTTIGNTKELIDVLKANRDIKGTQSGLTVAELSKLMDYYKIKYTELQNEITTVSDKKNKLDEVAIRLSNQINEEQAKNTNKAGRLVLQLSVALAGKYDFTISYISSNAYWTPFYDVRADDIKNPLKLIMKAKIAQTTGIDWKQVKLSLSTSLPSQYGAAPVLNTWFLSYINPVKYMNNRLMKDRDGDGIADQFDKEPVAEAMATTTMNKKIDNDFKIVFRGNRSFSGENQPILIVNGNEMPISEMNKINNNSVKSLDILKGEKATNVYGERGKNGAIVITLKDGLDDYVSVAENTMNIAFDIDLPYDVPTNGKPQTAIIRNVEIPAFFKHYAVPKLDKDAYLLAEIPDWEKYSLLPGEANIIFEGTYVGKSFIDPNSTSDTLNLTLGRDKRVSIKRDKVADFSSVKFLGSNKLQKFTYELTVKNNKKEAINLLLKDQFPLSTNKEVEVELIDAGGAEVNNDLGILNWKLNLAAGESKKIRFIYSVKYPKDKVLNLN